MTRHKDRVAAAYDSLTRGDNAPFLALFDDNIRFEFVGGGTWGGVYQGVKTYREQFVRYVVERIAQPFQQIPTRFLSDGDYLVMEMSSRNVTKDGRPYHNRYCMIMRFAGEKIIELTEYCDTALTISVLGERLQYGDAA